MKVCIKDNELNWNYHKVFGEEKAKADGYTIFEVPKGCEDCAFSDFDNNGFNVKKYNARKQKENTLNYENIIVSKIREKYTIDQEIALLRQRDTKPEEFAKYNAYVEQCKLEAKEDIKVGGGNE